MPHPFTNLLKEIPALLRPSGSFENGVEKADNKILLFGGELPDLLGAQNPWTCFVCWQIRERADIH